jgi:hypothetical protein
VKAKTNRATRHLSLTEVLVSLNRMLRGWANYFRHGVSKQTFGAIDNHAWHCITKWIFHKYSRLSWQQLRRRFCLPGSWTLAHDGTKVTGASSVKVVRYRYRGSRSRPHGHRDRQPPLLAVDQRARHVERPVRGDTHAGSGGRAGETHREQSRQGAPVRPNPAAITVSGSARETNGTKSGVRMPDGLRTVHDWPWTVAAPGTFLTNTPSKAQAAQRCPSAGLRPGRARIVGGRW